MRLYLLPVSTRRTLLYAQRINVTIHPDERGLVDKGAAFAARKWAEWERRDRGWQRRVVDYGNHAFRRIPFEEWGLKSVPPLSARRKEEERAGPRGGDQHFRNHNHNHIHNHIHNHGSDYKDMKTHNNSSSSSSSSSNNNNNINNNHNNSRGADCVELVFPPTAIPAHTAKEVVGRLATERQALHRKRMMWCFVGMPIVAPFALVPVIPNIPFFYLAYRAWSHWRALSGGKHIQWLIQNDLLSVCPSPELGRLYGQEVVVAGDVQGDPEKRRDRAGSAVDVDIKRNSNTSPEEGKEQEQEQEQEPERILISREQTKEISALLDLPSLETELERAIWQVEQSVKRETRQKRGGGT